MDDREAYEYYADPENLRVTGPAYKPRRQVPVPVRTFACPHLSISNVAWASCGTCGQLKAAA